MTQPVTMDEAHSVCAEVAGELSLAIVRKAGSKAMMLRWIERLRFVADAFEAKIRGVRQPVEPDPRCIGCGGSGRLISSPSELGWRRVSDFEWVTPSGIRVPGDPETVAVACACTEEKR